MKRLFLTIGVAAGLFPPMSPASAQPVSFSFVVDGREIEVGSATTLSWFELETRPEIKLDRISEIADYRLCPSDPVFCEFSLSRHARVRSTIELSERVDRSAIRTSVDALADQVRRDPVSATFGVRDGQVVPERESIDGLELDTDGSVDRIASALASGMDRAELDVRRTAPRFRSDDIAKLGLRELVAEGTTSFRGSPKNRVHNIHRAIEQFHGVLIAPDEEFSFVEHLGEVDGPHGYLPELVIKHDRTEPEFGGGICQVSTTMFRTAIHAGMKITERRNHAYPVSYYKPYGFDATVYVPAPDLRFTNNTGSHILVQASIDGTDLTFRFYGSKDGRTVAVDGPHIISSNPDGSMKTVFTQTVSRADGTVLIEDRFPSSYKSPDLFPHFEILSEKPKDWSRKQWDDYLEQKADYEAKLRAAYATVVKPESPAPSTD